MDMSGKASELYRFREYFRHTFFLVSIDNSMQFHHQFLRMVDETSNASHQIMHAY